jgi:hypothetical protein
VEVTRHCPLVLLVKIVLETRQRVEKLRRKCDRKGTVGHLQQEKLSNCVFGVQHYDEILITLGGLHRGEKYGVNFGQGCMVNIQRKAEFCTN